MLQRFIKLYIVSYLFYSLPVQLLILNFKKNQLLLLLWLLLLLIVLEYTGETIGVPSLFLEPEYLNQVNFQSFFLVGMSLGVFTMSYHISCYILDAPQFAFLGTQRSPFAKFLINNTPIPSLVMLVYLIKTIRFQLHDKIYTEQAIYVNIAGLLVGYLLAAFAIYLYFIRTNKDIIKLFTAQVDKTVRRSIFLRVNVLQRLNTTREHKVRVDYFFNNYFIPTRVDDLSEMNSYRILKVFDQNHLNGVIIQTGIFVFVLILGLFRDYAYFQIPAAASLVLLFTLVAMLIGALSYWLRGWTFSVIISILLVVNYLMQAEILKPSYEAYGLDYDNELAEYSLNRIKDLSSDENVEDDMKVTLIALDNWRKKFPPSQKPKMIFICSSGGGQRAALWTMRTLQVVDSTLKGKLMDHTMLMTGASGGSIGAAYFRELYLQQKLGKLIDIHHPEYLDDIAKDNLNAIMFSLVVNDLFLGLQTFRYNGRRYYKDRGYALEEQLNKNTGYLMDKPLCDYKEYELLGEIPMLILAPTIINDGRKLYISPMNISYMTMPYLYQTRFLNQKAKGIEFLRFFENQDANSLRFITALRMSATFPYVTPNIKLPSNPEMEIMDAGFSDNFGVSDAVRFLYTFRNWISQNTSGVVFVSIRDTQKDKPIEESLAHSLFQRFFSPIGSIFINLEYVQDIKNDDEIEFAQSWFKGDIQRIEFQYIPVSKSLEEIREKQWKEDNEPEDTTQNEVLKIIKIERAALSWRLTNKEKENIKRTIYELRNQSAIRQLKLLLEE